MSFGYFLGSVITMHGMCSRRRKKKTEFAVTDEVVDEVN